MFLRKLKDKYILSDLSGQIIIISRSKDIAIKYGRKIINGRKRSKAS